MTIFAGGRRINGPLSLRHNFVWALIGSLVASGCQWAMLVVIAKLLSAEEVGYFALALAITAPIVMFSMLQLRAVYVTDSKNEIDFRYFLGLRLLTNLLAVIIVFVVLSLISGRYSLGVYIVILIVALNKLVEATSDIAYGVVQKNNRLDIMAKSMMVRNFGALVFLFLVILLTHSLIIGVLSIGVWWLIILVFFDKPRAEIFTSFRPRFKPEVLLHLLYLSVPLGVATGIQAANSAVPRYFIEGYLGTESLGYFSAMAYTVAAALRLILALGQSAAARLAEYYVSNRRAYIRLLLKMAFIVLVLAVGTVILSFFFGKAFLTIVYKPEYAEDMDVFIWLMIAAGGTMLAAIFGYGMTAVRRFKSHIPVFGVAGLVSLLGSWLLVPAFGMRGAAWAMLASTLAQCAGSLFVIVFALRAPKASMEKQQQKVCQ